MSFAKSLTQGGQVTLHNLRMIQQVMKVTSVVSFVVGFGVFVALFFAIPERHRTLGLAYYWALTKTSIPLFDPSRIYQNLPITPTQIRPVRSVEVLTNPTMQRYKHQFEAAIIDASLKSFLSALGFFILCCGFWIHQGRLKKEKEVLEGTEEVTPKQLISMIEANEEAGPLTLSGVPLLRNKEVQHMLVVGTTGSGKTNCFHDLLQQIRAQKQRAVIVDVTGTFVQKYYRPGVDKILNPLDARSEKWTIWSECTQPYHFDELAASFIPIYQKDPFWTQSAQMLLSVCAQKLMEEGMPSLERLTHLLTIGDLGDLYRFLKGTKAAPLVSLEAKETAASIRSTLSSCLKSIDLLSDTDTPFSIQKWISDEESNPDSWLFLSSPPEMRETLRPLLSAWAGVSSKAIMSLEPCFERRLWIVIDELPALNKLQDIHTALAEHRKYGGCILLGTQDLSLLDDIYGSNLVKSLVNLCSTKMIFRIAGADVAERLSKWLGTQQIAESIENISYGAHQMRDGVSLNEQRRERPAINPDKLMKLRDLEGYLKLPGTYPVTKITFPYHDLPTLSPAIVRMGG